MAVQLGAHRFHFAPRCLSEKCPLRNNFSEFRAQIFGAGFARTCSMDGSTSLPCENLIQEVISGEHQPLEQATTLPPQSYTSEAFFQLEVERIFRKEWLVIGHISQLPRPGDYFTLDLLGEMLVVVRGTDRIRALSRICLHRWAPLVSGSGNTKRFSCPFHAWAYDLDGTLVGAPLMDQVDFTPRSCRLPEFRIEVVDGFIYLNFSEGAAPLAPQLADLSAQLKRLSPDDWVVAATLEYDCAINWKIMVETFMECYHHIAAHPETFERVYPARLSYAEDAFPAWTVCHAPARSDAADAQISVGFPDLGDLLPQDRREFTLYLVYPYHLLSVLPDRVFWFCLQPVSAARTRLQAHLLVQRDAPKQPDYHDRLASERNFLVAVNQEDIAVNEMQQRGAASRSAQVGRFSHLEKALWQLADYVRDRIKTD
jgi:phenylpropionate dioxygenase-like ring-hydroxylating dioxygenase large terminal subunit